MTMNLTNFRRLRATLTAVVAFAGIARGDELDLSGNFDQASDFSSLTVQWQSTADNRINLTSITDASGAVDFRTRRTAAGDAYASTLSSATFNPATQGTLNSISWSTEIALNSGSGISPGQMMPLLSQDGKFYVYKGGDILPNKALVGNTFYESTTTFVEELLTAALGSDFEELNTTSPGYLGGAGGGPVTIAASHPDFSSLGEEIVFGYMTINSSSGARDNQTLLRGTNVVLDFTAVAVPEPASILLWGLAGLASLVAYPVVRRRR